MLAAFSAVLGPLTSGPSAEGFASICVLLPHFKLHLQLTTSQGKLALEAHLGLADLQWLPTAGNKDSKSCVSSPSPFCHLAESLCWPSGSTSSWQEPAPSTVRSAPGENETPFPLARQSQLRTSQTCSPGLTFPCINPITASVTR